MAEVTGPLMYGGFTIPEGYYKPCTGATLAELCDDLDRELKAIGKKYGLKPYLSFVKPAK